MKFRIYITFETGDQHLDTDWCNQDTLMSSLQRLLHGPVSKMNIISEIKVVDLDDYIVFLVQGGKQIFPATIQLDTRATHTNTVYNKLTTPHQGIQNG